VALCDITVSQQWTANIRY